MIEGSFEARFGHDIIAGMSATPKPRHRWFRFSLRTLFVLVTLACLWLGLRSMGARQRGVVATLASKYDQHSSHPSLEVFYDYEWGPQGRPIYPPLRDNPPGPAWLHALLGVDLFQTVVGLYIDGATDVELAEIQPLKHLRWLHLTGDLSDAELQRLASFQNLTSLNLQFFGQQPRATDAGLAFLDKLTRLQSLTLWVTDAITADGLEPVARLANLEELDLTFDGRHGDQVLALVGKLRKLKKLHLNIEVGDSELNQGLVHLSKIDTLEEVHLSGPRNAQISPSNLGAISSLRRLTLVWWTGPSLDYLAGLDRLEKLDVSSRDLSPAGLSGLRALPRLQVLDLSSCDRVTLAGLKGCASLRELNLWLCRAISAGDLTDLGALPNLRVLRISHCDGISLKGLNTCQSLEEVSIDLSDTTGADLPHLAGLTKLRKLTLGGSNRLSLQQFPALPPSLEYLEIDRCRTLTDADAAALVASAGAVKHLTIELPDAMTDAALASIGRLTQLESLDVWIPPATTDAGIAQLHKLTRLKQLEISGRTNARATVSSMERLRQALPKCQFVYDRYY